MLCRVLCYGALINGLFLSAPAWAQSAVALDAPAVAPGASSPEPEAAGVTAEALWRGHPLPVALVVGQERRIDFPEPIADLDVPQAVTAHSRLVLTPTGQLHWQAQASFPATRVLATSISGTLYQLDVRADAEGAPPPPLAIRDPVVAALAAPGAGSRATPAAGTGAPDAVAAALIPDFLKGPEGRAPGASPDYVTMTRFALAHYAGPARLIPAVEASPAPLPPGTSRDGLRVQDSLLTVQPLASWKIGDHYVTTLGVVNRRPFPVDFDPRALRGDLRFAAALHPTLAPAGSGHQHTVWAVVTEQPYHRAVAADVAH